MKRKRKIRWGTPVVVKQFHTSGLGTERSLPGEFSLFLLCTLLWFGAAFGMLQGMFEWNVFSEGMLIRIAIVTVLVSGLAEAVSLLKPHLYRIAKVGIPVLGVTGCLFYLLRTKQGELVLLGLQAVSAEYVRSLNSYFNSSLSVAGGDVFLREKALEFVLSVLCFLTVWYSRVRKKNCITAVVPFVILVAGLLVGKVPTATCLLVGVGTLLLANAAMFRKPEFLKTPDKHGREFGVLKQIVWVPVAMVLLVLCVVVKTAGSRSAEEQVIRGKERLLQKQNELIQSVTEWEVWQDFRVDKAVEKWVDEFLHKRDINVENRPEANFARLDNEMPEYEEVAVLKVALEKNPIFGSYLVGFYADTYEDGVWDTDVEAFQKECEKAGYEPETVSDGLLTLAPDRVARYFEKETLEELKSRTINGWMYHAKANRIKAYLPYFSKTTAEGIRTEGDSRYIKGKSVTKFPFLIWNYDVEDLIRVLFRGGETEKAWKKEPWEVWYESYVTEHYLEYPKGMTQVKRVSEEIRAYDRDFFTVEGKESVNFYRINKAYQVADWMRRNTAYSLELPELPKGRDAVEFFLGTSRRGYCMHYASASTLILRELGVPARYVSGYVVGNYKKNDVSGMYEATVLDSYAHAWVEIYLEGIGWIPVEVTNGYSVSPAGEVIYRPTETGNYQMVKENWPEDKDTDKKDSEHSFSWTTTRPFTTPVPTPTQAPLETLGGDKTPPGAEMENESGESKTDGVEAPEASEENRKPGVAKDNGKNEKDKKLDLNVNPVILLFALPVVGFILGVAVPVARMYRKTASSFDERTFQKKTRRFGNRQRIKLLNRSLYRKLRRKKKIHRRFLRDEEYDEVLHGYRAVLRKEERERYMHLVKAAAFSYNEFSDEEVEFCKQVYHKVLYEKRMEDEDRL